MPIDYFRSYRIHERKCSDTGRSCVNWFYAFIISITFTIGTYYIFTSHIDMYYFKIILYYCYYYGYNRNVYLLKSILIYEFYKKMLSKEQQYIFEQYKLGKNIMMTGSAGCGKSYLIQQIAHDAKQSYDEKGMFQVTAMTGTAAVLLDCY